MTSVAGERVARALDEALAAAGVRVDELAPADLDFADGVVRSLAARLGARRRWEGQLGELLTHAQVLALTGWSKQALSAAVADHRVLKLVGEHSTASYLLAGYDDGHPARPLPGLAPVLTVWAPVDPRGWATGSWLTSPQIELGGRSPCKVLAVDGLHAVPLLQTLAEQATTRLAA